MVENKKVSYYYVRTLSTDPMDTQYDGLYTLESDWLTTFQELLTSDVDAYVYDIVKWNDDQGFKIQITGVSPSQLPEDVKDSLVNVPYNIAYILKILITDVRGKSEVYIFIPKD